MAISSFFIRHPRCTLALMYGVVLSSLLTYYCWQLTRDNEKLFHFVYEPNGGGFVDLSLAFLQGQVAILGSPDPKFADLKNPYNEDERQSKGVDYPWDFSYYRAPGEKLGKYYLYFQPGPVLLFYLPQHFLTGQLPSQRWVMFLLSSASLLFYTAFLRLLIISYFPKVPVSLEALLIIMYGLCNMNNYLQVDSNAYQIALCSATTFTIGFFLFILLSLESRTCHILWLFLASTCAGFAFGSRPTYVFLNILLVASWFFLLCERHKLVLSRFVVFESIALFLPSLLCCLASAWYNYARFGDIFEFGLTYQLNGGEYGRFKHFLLSYIPDSIWCYFLQPWHPVSHFPFADTEIVDDWNNLWFGRFRATVSGIFPAFPICLLAFAWPFYIKAQLPSQRDHIKFFGSLLSLWAFMMSLVVCAYFAVEHRYMLEPLFALILMTTFSLLMRRQKGPFYLWEKIILFVLFTYSFYFGIVYGLTGETHWVQQKLHDLYGWSY